MLYTIENLFEEEFIVLSKKLKEKLDADLKLSFYDLKTGNSYNVLGNKPGWAASLIKIPVMIAAFREIDQGRLSLEDELKIDHKFTLDPSSEVSYRPNETNAEVFELLNYMILASCNESTNMLADKIGIPTINKTMEELGCPNTKMGHLLYKGAPLIESGIDGTYSNTTTPNEITRLMKMVYQGEAASQESCDHMVAIIENKPEIEYSHKSINGYSNIGLPGDTVSGAKAGLLENDVMETCAINQEYILTVIINKIPSEFLGKCSLLIGGISRKIFDQYYKQ